METFLKLAIIPLLCMGVTILTAAVIIFALRRGTQAINGQAQTVIADKNKTQNANDRWARGDMQGETQESMIPLATIHCPACGGENPAGSHACTYCGRKL
jgi:hypothetical protein